MTTTQTYARPLTTDEERLAKMLKALGNPQRLSIMLFLAENPQCITGDIVAATPLAQSTVSQHLKVLRDAGLICGTIDGAATNYCVDEDALRWLRERMNAHF